MHNVETRVLTCKRSQLVHVEAGVHDDPGDQRARGPGEEALLGQIPDAPVLRLVNALDCSEPDIHQPGGERSEEGEAKEAVEGDEAPDGAQHQVDDLPRPVDHVQQHLINGRHH